MSMTERHVQAIWYDRELRPEKLYTRNGTRVRVVYPGEWNGVSGPDFKGAVLEIGSDHRRVVGDVEIHLSPADWDAHGHGTDPAYRNVVAHVTWHCGERPRTLPSQAVSIWLGRYLATDVSFSPDSIDLGAYPFGKQPIGERPCRRVLGGDIERAKEVIGKAGAWRMKVKAQRLKGMLTDGDSNQLFYSEVMNALGYSRNCAGFRKMAERVSYAVVRAEPENAAAAYLAAATFVDWNRDRLRPTNSPEHRLIAAAKLFTEGATMELARVSDSSAEGCRRMVKVLTEGGCMGRGRAAAIVANVVIPFALARGDIAVIPKWLPPEDVCAPVRRVAYRIFGGDHNPMKCYAENGLLIQGLIQIDREWCARNHPHCQHCPSERLKVERAGGQSL